MFGFPLWTRKLIPELWEECLTQEQQFMWLEKNYRELKERVDELDPSSPTNIDQTPITFTEQETYNIQSGNTVSILFGKIKHLINSLKRVAFTGSYNDLDDAPESLPSGGSTGQILTKTSDGSAWENVPTELPSGGTNGQVLKKTSDGVAWGDETQEIPSGGTTGQVLTKTSEGSAWDNVPTELPSGGSTGQILTKTSDGSAWENAPSGLPDSPNGADLYYLADEVWYNGGIKNENSFWTNSLDGNKVYPRLELRYNQQQGRDDIYKLTRNGNNQYGSFGLYFTIENDSDDHYILSVTNKNQNDTYWCGNPAFAINWNEYGSSPYILMDNGNYWARIFGDFVEFNINEQISAGATVTYGFTMRDLGFITGYVFYHTLYTPSSNNPLPSGYYGQIPMCTGGANYIAKNINDVIPKSLALKYNAKRNNNQLIYVESIIENQWGIRPINIVLTAGNNNVGNTMTWTIVNNWSGASIGEMLTQIDSADDAEYNGFYMPISIPYGFSNIAVASAEYTLNDVTTQLDPSDIQYDIGSYSNNGMTLFFPSALPASLTAFDTLTITITFDGALWETFSDPYSPSTNYRMTAVMENSLFSITT